MELRVQGFGGLNPVANWGLGGSRLLIVTVTMNHIVISITIVTTITIITAILHIVMIIVIVTTLTTLIALAPSPFTRLQGQPAAAEPWAGSPKFASSFRWFQGQLDILGKRDLGF